MPAFLISPAEPPLIKTLGTVSAVPELHGADILWHESTVGLIGVQRKEVTDFIDSIRDNRLAKEVAQLKQVALPIVIIEGKPHWTPDGELVSQFTRWSRDSHWGVIRSLQSEHGIVVETTESIDETIGRIEAIAKWAAKPEHSALKRRNKPASSDGWGSRSDRDYACWILQSVEGIGRKQAEQILDHFEGKLPLSLTVDTSELLKVKGVGPKTVAALARAFGEKLTTAC